MTDQPGSAALCAHGYPSSHWIGLPVGTDPDGRCPGPAARCPDHAMPLLDDRKVEAYVTLLDWPGTTRVVHACEARLEIAKEWAHD